MADMITRCPKCGTAFRISDALLKSAKGVVRCGSCLSVFNAKEHLETKPAPTVAARETPPPPPRTAPPASKPEPQPEPESDRDDPESVVEDLNPWRSQRPEDSLFERRSTNVQDDEEDDEDEAWALELLKDDSDLNVRFKKISSKPAAPAASNPPPAAQPVPPRQKSEPAPVPSPAPVPEPPITAAAAEPEVVAFKPEPQPAVPEQIHEPTADAAARPVVNTPNAATPPAAAKRKPIRPKFEPKSVPLEQVIAALEPEPLELDWQQPGSWKKRLLWPLLMIVALVCLLLQVAWLEFNRLSRLEPYRSAYGFACQILGCTLPELRDLPQIQTSNLVVRSHPELDGVLQVDVILQNNATFEQAFPNIQLTFTDLNNNPVATRKLQPQDYLGGELTGRDTMPVRQPIHIGLEIADPGREAVSYHISIVE